MPSTPLSTSFIHDLTTAPTLAQLRSHPTAPLQAFSKMPNDSKIRTMRTVKAIARFHGKRLIVANTESFNHHSGRKSDMFGIVDAEAIECDYAPGALMDDMESYLSSFKGTRTRYLQACSADWVPHIEKFKENIETCALLLSPGNTTLELWGWRKVKRRGHMVYRPRLQLITVAFLLGKERAQVIEVFPD